jgi:dihydrofolate reductase
MRNLTYLVAVSLDGFIAHLDGSHDGFSQNQEYLTQLFVEFPETVPSHFRDTMGITDENRWFDTVLMGRKTYEVGLKDGFTNPYAHLRQYVFSRTMETSPDAAVTLVREDAIAQVKALKAEDGKDIWLCGGGSLASELLEAGLIDALMLKVNPFLMGVGIPLFAKPVPPTQLLLQNSQSYPGGIMLLHYDVTPNSNSI